jgi:hypothetical protein
MTLALVDLAQEFVAPSLVRGTPRGPTGEQRSVFIDILLDKIDGHVVWPLVQNDFPVCQPAGPWSPGSDSVTIHGNDYRLPEAVVVLAKLCTGKFIHVQECMA